MTDFALEKFGEALNQRETEIDGELVKLPARKAQLETELKGLG